MTFQMNDNDRIKPTITVAVSFDPATATIALAIDGTEHACTWVGAATETGGTWTREAITNGYLAGPAVPVEAVDGATVIAYGTHNIEVRVINGSVIKAARLTGFTVRHYA